MDVVNRLRFRRSLGTLFVLCGLLGSTAATAQNAPAGAAPAGTKNVAWSPERITSASRSPVSALDPTPNSTPMTNTVVVGARYAAAPVTTVSTAPADPAIAGVGGGQLALLVRNPKQEQGLPPFALADQTGTVQRYVEPVDGVDLERFVGQVVIVRHDTGRTLLASQLELPQDGPFTPGQNTAARARRDRAVEPAQYVEHADYRQTEPELAEPPQETQAEDIPKPRWAAEEIPPGNSLYTPPAFEEDFGPHSEYCPHCESGYCNGGAHWHQPGPHGPYRDYGLFGSCLHGYCRPTGCGPGARGMFYARGEYLWWWFDGMHVPLLVVAGEVDGMGTATDTDDVLLVDEILFGGDEVFDEERHGGRITVGWFLDPCGFHAIEGDYLSFGTTSTGFFVEGDPILPDGTGMIPDGQRGIGRPFFSFPGTVSTPSIEDVVFTNIGGSLAIDITSNFETAGLRLRHNICCVSACQPGCADCCDVACGSCCGTGPCQRGGFGTRRIDMTWGVRYANLEERLAIVEDLQRADGDGFFLVDSFGTDNDFYGGELGFIWEWEYRRWKVDLLSRLAVGNVRQRVVIDGSTIMTAADGDVQVGSGGLLALNSNIGSQDRDKLAVLPEIGITLGYQLTCNWSFTVGYSFMYWSSVVRPGDQIDLDVNENLIPDPGDLDPTPGPFDRPRAFFEQTDFFAHGVNFGLEYRH